MAGASVLARVTIGWDDVGAGTLAGARFVS